LEGPAVSWGRDEQALEAKALARQSAEMGDAVRIQSRPVASPIFPAEPITGPGAARWPTFYGGTGLMDSLAATMQMRGKEVLAAPIGHAGRGGDVQAKGGCRHNLRQALRAPGL
jgi:hypothetical protein